MGKTIKIRLSDSEYDSLQSVSEGNMSGWIKGLIHGASELLEPKKITDDSLNKILENESKVQPVIKTKEDAIKAVQAVKVYSRPAHALNCTCLTCRPPKEK